MSEIADTTDIAEQLARLPRDLRHLAQLHARRAVRAQLQLMREANEMPAHVEAFAADLDGRPATAIAAALTQADGDRRLADDEQLARAWRIAWEDEFVLYWDYKTNGDRRPRYD